MERRRKSPPSAESNFAGMAASAALAFLTGLAAYDSLPAISVSNGILGSVPLLAGIGSWPLALPLGLAGAYGVASGLSFPVAVRRFGAGLVTGVPVALLLGVIGLLVLVLVLGLVFFLLGVLLTAWTLLFGWGPG